METTIGILIIIIWLLCGHINCLKIKEYPHKWFLILSGAVMHIAVIFIYGFITYIKDSWNFKIPLQEIEI